MQKLATTSGAWELLARLIAWVCVLNMLAFIANNVLIFWFGWPGALAFINGEAGDASLLGGLQLASYALANLMAVLYVWRRQDEARSALDSQTLSAISAYIVRAAFWSVFLIGIADVTLAILRSEGGLEAIFGNFMAQELTRPSVRGLYIQYPLILCGLAIAAKNRNLGFTWLALLVVIAEFLIVVARFIFSYEQPFMGDLVRFWYAAMFLFASAYTLAHDGHVRVDVFYTSFPQNRQALFNALGCLFLGLPICWVIITLGMWEKTHIINAPLLNFEVSQSGFGMYVKHLMAGFLLIYAISMMIQFCAYFLKNVCFLNGKTEIIDSQKSPDDSKYNGIKEF